ncbi:glycosyltransferase family 9 protein [Pelagicoccus sp. SDUM812005]|uniref:glycosyltransferase family 9 protein n=1 Tax=Pelagicoccus sp. SDUM812005 TaxID=3041257 RepID=UPI00280EE532|nr:glycosyltransferase family 9 protein [Pelagicoccus sp. SDUM812005]MDQ8179700.1 glycosyltransferase family 9 protein [Pelagicoccus sp. SDUM812005]
MSAAKVLILMTSPLDKIVHALRVVEAIKRQHPDLEVTWVVRRFYEPLVGAFDFVDRTIVFRRSEAITSFAGLVREIRQERYDFVLDFEGYARTGAMCFFAKGQRKIGLRSAREGASICYGEVVSKASEDRRHLLERFQDFGSVFGLKPVVDDRLPLPRGTGVPAEVGSLLESGSTVVCLFPGRFKAQRSWGRMLELASKLVSERQDVQVLILGVVPYVFEEPLPRRVHDFQERYSWSELCSIVAESKAVVANDNGPAQLAGALGVPNLTLYSFVSPSVRGAYPLEDPANAGVRAPQGEVALLDFDEVYAEVEKLLAL